MVPRRLDGVNRYRHESDSALDKNFINLEFVEHAWRTQKRQAFWMGVPSEIYANGGWRKSALQLFIYLPFVVGPTRKNNQTIRLCSCLCSYARRPPSRTGHSRQVNPYALSMRLSDFLGR